MELQHKAHWQLFQPGSSQTEDTPHKSCHRKFARVDAAKCECETFMLLKLYGLPCSEVLQTNLQLQGLVQDIKLFRGNLKEVVLLKYFSK